MTYRIEKRSDTDLPKVWTGSEWVYNSLRMKIYTEAERAEFLNRELRGEPNKFPEGGIWVRLESREQIRCGCKCEFPTLPTQPKIDHYWREDYYSD